jgi:hypothetical protein
MAISLPLATLSIDFVRYPNETDACARARPNTHARPDAQWHALTHTLRHTLRQTLRQTLRHTLRHTAQEYRQLKREGETERETRGGGVGVDGAFVTLCSCIERRSRIFQGKRFYEESVRLR